MKTPARLCGNNSLALPVLAALVLALGACGTASAQVNPNVIWGGVPDQSVLNGLWFDSYNAFSPQARYGAFAGWWDFYLPPLGPDWSTGPYFTVVHWDPYFPQPIQWSGLEYSIANAPPDSTRPHGWYGTYSPGWRSSPVYAYEFWEYIGPELQAVALATEIGWGVGYASAVAAAAAETTLIPPGPPNFRQYIPSPNPEPGKSAWRAIDARNPEPARIADASRATDVPTLRQYYRETAPGPNQGRWVARSAGPKR